MLTALLFACQSSRAERPPIATQTQVVDASAAVPLVADAALDASDGGAPEASEPDAAPEVQMPDFDAGGSPESKLELIEALDRGLRSGSLDELRALVPNGRPLVDACAGRVAPEMLAAPRHSLDERFAECLELADWKRARKMALNFGTRSDVLDRVKCPELSTLEKSELFYGIGDTTYKVTLYGITYRGAFAASRVHCVKKRGSPREFLKLRANCPGRPWSRVTQSAGQCP